MMALSVRFLAMLLALTRHVRANIILEVNRLLPSLLQQIYIWLVILRNVICLQANNFTFAPIPALPADFGMRQYTWASNRLL